MPTEVQVLLRTYGYPGSSLALRSSVAIVSELWQAKANEKGGSLRWRALHGRALTHVSRMDACPQRDLVAGLMRECARGFQGRSLLTWKPYVLLCMGLLGEPLSTLEGLCRIWVKRCWPVAQKIAERVLRRRGLPLADCGEKPEGEPLPGGCGGGPTHAPAGPAAPRCAKKSKLTGGDHGPRCGEQIEEEFQASEAPAAHSSAKASAESASSDPAPAPAGPSVQPAMPPPSQPLHAAGPPEVPKSMFDDTPSRSPTRQTKELNRLAQVFAEAAGAPSPRLVLGVDSGDARDARDAFRSLALLVHPDKGGTEWAFRMVREAFEKF